MLIRSRGASTGGGFYLAQLILPGSIRIKCLDHKGRDAGMIWPPNWTICQQNPAPGAKITDQMTLTVIKRGKACTVNH